MLAMSTSRHSVNWFFAVVLSLLLAACGGGGGGGSSSSSSSGGGFTVSATTLSFSADQNGAPPPSQDIQTSFTNPEAYYVGAAYPPGVSPASWLTITETGAGNSYTFHFSVNTTSLSPGTYTTTVGLGIARQDGSIIAYKYVDISYTVKKALTVSSAALTFNSVFGSSATINNQIVNINGTGLAWTASVNQPWVKLANTGGTAPGALSVGVDKAGLGVGQYSATITISSAGLPDVSVNVTLVVARPTLSISSGSATLGGNNGRDFSALPVQASLNTGASAYAWSANSSNDWIQISPASGLVASGGVTINLSPKRDGLKGGTYTGTVNFTANVNGEIVTATLPVTFNLDAHKLLVAENGVALTSTPSLSKLTRSVRVADNMQLATSWSASSNQPWLTVTSSGVTNDDLVLTANPSGLATDTMHYATVSVSSSDSTVENTEIVRVGLWVGSSTPGATTTITATYSELQADPIRPYVYLHNGGTDITVYNVYTGTVVATLSHVGTQLGNMAITHDGSTLYVVDDSAKTIVPIDLDTDTIGTPWSLDAPSGIVTPTYIAYARINGFPAIITSHGTIFDAARGTPTASTFVFDSPAGYVPILAASLNGNRFCGINSGLSPYTISCYPLDYTSVGGGGVLVGTGISGTWGIGSNGRDVALNSDGTRVYAASGAPYAFVVYDPTTTATTMPVLQYLTADSYPVAISVRSDGRIYGGAAVWYGPKDVWIYNPDGSLITNYYVSGYAKWLLPRMLTVSGDGLRMITQTDDPRLQFTTVGP